MPITLRHLDDRRFSDLVDEGKRLIPGLAPSWTDHNPSDAGITFIELFAFVTELLMYRADRISEANKWAFVRLLRGCDVASVGGEGQSVDDAVRLAVLDLVDEQRAITADDFERLAGGVPGLARAHCLPGVDLDSGWNVVAPAHVSVLVVGKLGSDIASLVAEVRDGLAPRCLLTTRLWVGPPRYLPITVNVTACVFADQNEEAIRSRIIAALGVYFDPILGGVDGTGWPFGQAVYVSDLYAYLDGVAAVDYLIPFVDPVTGAQLPELATTDQDSEQRTLYAHDPKQSGPSMRRLVGMSLRPDELVGFAGARIRVIRQDTLA